MRMTRSWKADATVRTEEDTVICRGIPCAPMTNWEQRSCCRKGMQVRIRLLPFFRGTTSGHLLPPVVNRSDQCKENTTHHYIVEVSNNEVCIVKCTSVARVARGRPVRPPMVVSRGTQVCTTSQCSNEQNLCTRLQSMNMSWSPSELLHQMWWTRRLHPLFQTDQRGKDGVPDDKTNTCNRDCGCCDRCISKDVLSRMYGYRFGNNAESRKNHYIYNRMRVEPEEVWNRTGSPPRAGSKMPIPAVRSKISKKSVTAITGVARSWINDVAYNAQINKGIFLRHTRARIMCTVTMVKTGQNRWESKNECPR